MTGVGQLRDRWRVLAWAGTSLAVSVPFLVTDWVPWTDLPQHAAQIRLLHEALAAPDAGYVVQWTAPYVLGLLPWALTDLPAPPLVAVRCGALLLALLWVGAVHGLAARFRRPPSAAVLASLLLFDHATYWGFVGFVAGGALFFVWLWALERPAGRRAADFLVVLLLSLALYWTHALWFAVAVLWAMLNLWRATFEGRRVQRLIALLPGLALAVPWFVSLRSGSFGSPPVWLTSPLERLSPSKLVDGALGGLPGAVEPALFSLFVLWIGLGMMRALRGEAMRPEPQLLAAATMLFSLYCLLPDKYTNTTDFSARWLPYVVVLALLSVPPPTSRRAWRAFLAAIGLAALMSATALAWRAWEREEMSGLDAALAALPPAPVLLGLDYRRETRLLDGSATFQAFAYAQVLRGGRLNFSFADFPHSLVVFDPKREPTWTWGLEWFPWLLRSEDLRSFDHVLVHAGPEIQRVFARDPLLRPVTRRGAWRLYRTLAATGGG